MPLRTFSVGGILYPSLNSSNGIALDIFLSGCARKEKCPGCHNPELWDFNNGIKMTLEDIKRVIVRKRVIDSVAVMGGEPLHHKNLPLLLQMIRKSGKKVWLYTSYGLHEIPESIKVECDFIKTGKYEENNRTPNGSWLSSYNQEIFKREGSNFELYYASGEIVCEM